MLRRERDYDPVAVDLDALRLGDHRAVEELLDLADLFQERVLQTIGRDRIDRRQRCRGLPPP